MMTDVQELKERGLQVSCINLSCGYYEPHTDHEFTIKKDLMNCLSLVEHIIENCTDTYPHQAEIPGRRRGIYDEFDEAWMKYLPCSTRGIMEYGRSLLYVSLRFPGTRYGGLQENIY